MPSKTLFSIIAGSALALTVAVPTAQAQQDPRWMEPIPSFRIADRLYYVGSRDLAAYLIDSGDGLILLDTGLPQFAPHVLANIRALGFDPRSIRILLTSQAHFDHAGGLAAVKAASGARMLASDADAALLERGGKNDIHFGDEFPYPPVKVDDRLRDGQVVKLGRVAMTAHLTPGHTPGCTTWTMPVTIQGRRQIAQFVCGTSAPGYKLVGNARDPDVVADFRGSFTKLRRLPCDIFLGAHGSYFGLDEKRAKLAAVPAVNPFLDRGGCRRHVDAAEKAFEDQLNRQKAEARGTPK